MGNYYYLTKQADADIGNILRRTQEQWGTAQKRKYAESLDKCFNDIG